MWEVQKTDFNVIIIKNIKGVYDEKNQFYVQYFERFLIDDIR
jgi:hypothetical protein